MQPTAGIACWAFRWLLLRCPWKSLYRQMTNLCLLTAWRWDRRRHGIKAVWAVGWTVISRIWWNFLHYFSTLFFSLVVVLLTGWTLSAVHFQIPCRRPLNPCHLICWNRDIGWLSPPVLLVCSLLVSRLGGCHLTATINAYMYDVSYTLHYLVQTNFQY